MEAIIDLVEELARRPLAVGLDPAEATGVGGDPSEPDGGRRVAIENARQLARPVGEHLVDVRQHLARAPLRLRLRAPVRAERPWLSGDERATKAEQGVAGIA